MRVQERVQLDVLIVERGVDRVRGQHRGQRQIATGQAFRKAQEVGSDVRLVAGKHRPRAPKTDSDLVGNQVDAVSIACLSQQAQIHGVVHSHVAGALHERLDDHRGGLAGVTRERGFHVRELASAVSLPALSCLTLKAVGRGN